MRRYTGQKALYEAIARTQAKLQRRGILERLHTGNGGPEEAPPAVETPKPQAEPVSVQVEPVKPPVEKPVAEKPFVPVVKPVRPVEHAEPQPRPAQPWLRPKTVQVHDGRIEISLPYTIGVTVLLAAVLLVLGAFRLGQMQHQLRLPAVNDGAASQAKPPAPKTDPIPAKQETPAAPVQVTEKPATDTGGTATVPAKQGDHVIVLAQHQQQKALEAAQKYFAQNGIATDVIDVATLRAGLNSRGVNTNVLGTRGGYMLVSDLCDNPENPGTEGYKLKQRIKEVGRGYKAPAGLESFAPKYFSDAYGMKVR
jgi:hypothetical protein